MKCDHCRKFITDSTDICPFCGRSLSKTGDTYRQQLPIPERPQNAVTDIPQTNETKKKIFLVVLALLMLTFAVLLNIPDAYGLTLREKIKYIPVETKLVAGDFSGAQEALKNMNYDNYNTSAWQAYYIYAAGRIHFDEGRYYSAYHRCFDSIRGFRDVDEYYDRDEYDHADLVGGWKMYNSQIGTDFYLFFDGLYLTLTLADSDGRSDTDYILENSGDRRYDMISSDGEKKYYMYYIGGEWSLYEKGTDELIGNFSKMDDGY